MNELIERLSSCNLFNCLPPGVFFVALAEQQTGFSFVQDNLLLAAFVYYFIGLVISRLFDAIGTNCDLSPLKRF